MGYTELHPDNSACNKIIDSSIYCLVFWQSHNRMSFFWVGLTACLSLLQLLFSSWWFLHFLSSDIMLHHNYFLVPPITKRTVKLRELMRTPINEGLIA